MNGATMKAEGMQRARLACDEPVTVAQRIAVLLAKRHGEVYADMIRDWMADGNDFTRRCLAELDANPKSWGSCTSHPLLVSTERIHRSVRDDRHCGTQLIWRYQSC